jgi:hypothetical protein
VLQTKIDISKQRRSERYDGILTGDRFGQGFLQLEKDVMSQRSSILILEGAVLLDAAVGFLVAGASTTDEWRHRLEWVQSCVAR